jgi:serine/threonine protein kinase
MEYLDGGSLEELIKRKGRLGPRLAVGIVRQVASALDHIHSRGVINLDVKPRNILFRRCRWAWLRPSVPQAVLCDFGLARGPGYPPPEKKPVTPDYMSPEQFQESVGISVPVDHRSDIFSLGVVLYEMTTGQVPFDDPGLLLEENPAPPSSLNPHIPCQLEVIILRCLAKDPGQRYQTAADLERDLSAVPLPPDWGLLARYGLIGLALAGGMVGVGSAWLGMASLWSGPTATPTPTVTLAATATFTPAPTVVFTPTAVLRQGVVTSTPLPTYTATPTPPTTATPTPTPTVEATP